MIGKIFDAVFGCHHSQYSFPITVRPSTRRNAPGPISDTYVVCLECGKEMPYDWQRMKVTSSAKQASVPVAALARKEAA